MSRANVLIAAVLSLSILSTIAARLAQADVRLPGFFGDSMVLQQGIKLPVWGFAAPGEQVTVAIAGQKASAAADKDGKWRVTLEPLKADGSPLEMTVSGKNTIVIKDVLVGEVWLCGGQSNMDIGVANSINAEQEIAAANFPAMRAYKSTRPATPVPQTDQRGNWSVCSPQSAGNWSATGFFFARYLHAQLGVPVGIIDTSRGSTAIRAWLSIESLKTLPPNPAPVEEYEKFRDAMASRTIWLQQQTQREDNPAANAAPDTDVSKWTSVTLPVAKDKNPFAEPGIYWLRKQVDIPQQWVGQDLNIGPANVADADQPYANGKSIEGGVWIESFGGLGGRWYPIRAAQVKGTKLTLAFRILNITGNPCFNDIAQPLSLTAGKMEKDEKPIILDGAWLMRQAVKINAAEMPAVPAVNPFFDEDSERPEGYYNSSVYPVAPYAVRGAIWYQGEADAERPDYYARALPTLITQWRQLWGQGDFAFGVVQLPSFHYPQELAINDGWPEFREAQYKGVQAVKNAGIVVTIDIGEPLNIHPRNKQDVGKRLGLWALANVYDKKDLPWSGPLYKSMKVEGDKVRVTFDHADGLLAKGGGDVKGFAIAGADKVFRFAKARIDGDSVVVWSDKVKEPLAVRYAWAENPVCNLYNKADLPTMPFRTDDWILKDIKAAEDERIPFDPNKAK